MSKSLIDSGPPLFDLFKLSDIPGLYIEYKKNVMIEKNAIKPLSYTKEGLPLTGKKIQIRYAINALGFRDHKYNLDDLRDQKVIIAIGDSTTYGTEVSLMDTYTKALEQIIKKEIEDVRVINSGVFGYNLKQYAIYLEYLLTKISPQSVIVGIYMNDHIPYSRLKPFIFFLNENSRFFNELSYLYTEIGNWFKLRTKQKSKRELTTIFNDQTTLAIKKYAQVFEVDPYFLGQSIQEMNDINLWNKALVHLKEIQQLCRDKNISLFCLIFPRREQLLFGYSCPEPQKTIMTYLQNHNIAFIDLTPTFKSAVNNNFLIYDSKYDPSHFNALGHRLVAQELYKTMFSDRD